jgi:hypothetical protein
MVGLLIGAIILLFFLASGTLPDTTAFPGVRPLIQVGPINITWRDILALAVAGLAIYGVYSNSISVQDALLILGAIIVGKAITK